MKFSIRFSSVIVFLVLGLNLWFTTEVFQLIRDTGIEPVVLIPSFFGFTTVELWCLKDIKKEKVRKGGEEHDS